MRIELNPVGSAPGRRAMTLPETMVNVTIFSLAVAALLAVNIFGLQQDQVANSKLGASDQSRIAFNLLIDELRAGKNVQIGSGTHTNFTPITNGPQTGNAIQIILSTDTNYLIYYFYTSNTPLGELSTNGNWLVRVSAYSNNLATNVVARNLLDITNQWMNNAQNFSALGLNGTNWSLLTNDPAIVNNRNYVVNALLQFYQYQYPLTRVGTNGAYLYDYYQLNLQASRRSIN